MSGSPPLHVAETAFEKRRGISSVEVRTGYAQIHVSRLPEPIMNSRLDVLRAVADAGISIDFLKLTPTGLSFLVTEDESAAASAALQTMSVHYTSGSNRHIVLVHAVNMRDEEGLIARILLEAIASGVQVDHVSDMHDRMLLVVGAHDSETLKARIEETLMGAAVAR